MHWYVLVTRPHHERVVYDRLVERSVQAYLPWATVWRTTTHGPRHATRPLFRRHLFVRCYLDRQTELALLCVPGVQRILEDPHGQWLVIPDDAIQSLQQLSRGGVVPVWAKALLGPALPDGQLAPMA